MSFHKLVSIHQYTDKEHFRCECRCETCELRMPMIVVQMMLETEAFEFTSRPASLHRGLECVQQFGPWDPN